MTREEAIEIVKTQYSHDSVMKTALGMLIPELCESSDEIIRSAMIKGFNFLMEKREINTFAGTPIRNILAYLEKQKEQKPTWNEEDKRILKGIIGKIDHDQTYGVSKGEMLNFLEDLRPSWKPLKQQMDALHEAVIRSCSHHYGVELLSLEIDLLNLK